MIETDDNGYVLLPNGDRSYAQLLGGYVHAMIRADDEATWQAAAEARNLLVRTTVVDVPAVTEEVVAHSEPVVYDEDGLTTNTYDGEYTWTRVRDGEILFIRIDTLEPAVTHDEVGPAPHVHISGPMYPVITPAVIDEERHVTTPAVTDTRPHYNLRIAPWAQETLASDGVTPRCAGTPITEADRNAAEQGIYTSGITVLDPQTIASPQRVWAG
jgi:hypothetical protein